MAQKQDYIPSRDADFDHWFENLKNYVVGKTGAGIWTHIPPERLSALIGAYDAWRAAYEKTLGAHS
ncbi:MAG: hypothetical protein LBI91_06355, partial [Spirochaetaceae bacterium]|nr:hypothetical protein [Spirochaetaceae bacterium]